MNQTRAVLFAMGIAAAAGVAMSAKDREPSVAPVAQSRPAGAAFEGRGPGPGRPGQRLGPQRNTPRDPEVQPQALTPEEIEQFLSFCREHFPQVHDQLTRARRDNPHEFRQMLRRVEPPLRRLMRLWRDDPAEARRVIEIQKIEMRIRALRQRYQQTRSESDRALIREEARELLASRFDLKLAKLREEVDRLRQRLDEQSRRLNEQDQSKERIVREEFSRMFEPSKGADKGFPGRKNP